MSLNETALRVLRGKRLFIPSVSSPTGQSSKAGQHDGLVLSAHRAGIQNFRWHDLRHTWPSWHVKDRTPPHVLQEPGGWEAPAMVRRYAHLSRSVF